MIGFRTRIVIAALLAAAGAAPAGAEMASFVHTVTEENRGCTFNQCTYFSHPLLYSGFPRWFFTPIWNPPGSPGVYYDDPLKVSSINVDDPDGLAHGIQGIDTMPLGAAFNVLIITEPEPTFEPETPCLYVHVANASNITGNYTEVDLPGLTSNPGAILLVTLDVLGPPRPIGVQYAGSRWRIVNLDLAPMANPTGFTLLDVACATDRWRGFVHTATVANTTGASTRISDPALDNHERVHLLVTPNVNAGGSPAVLNPHAVGVWYNDFVPPPHLWAVFNEDLAAMPAGADFNVAEIKVLFASGFERGSTAGFDVTVP